MRRSGRRERGAIGAATLVGLINSQTAAPSESPANVEAVAIDYGS